MPGAGPRLTIRSGGSPPLWMAIHPVTVFLILAIGVTWAAQISSILILGTILPGLLAELLILLGSAVLVTAAAEGRPGVRRLFGQTIRWRAGVGWYAVVLLALPVLTLLLAAATGTLRNPDGGWPLIHLPMAFGAGGFTATPADQVLVSWAVLIIFAPFLRCLVGMTYLGTGGSILLVGLLHASFNSSGGMPMAGGWQQIAAVVLRLAAVAAVWRYQGMRARRTGRQGQASGPAVR